MEPFNPFVTVVIRSFNRLDELRSLVAIVLAQSHANLEVLIVDSTPGLNAEQVQHALATDDARLRVIHTPPRGCAAAANEGVRQARGEIIAFVDDDDLPEGPDWLATHVRNYRDPLCLGVNGFMIYDPEHRAGPALVPALRRWRMLSHGFFKQPRCYAYDEQRKVGIDYLMGGNASIRRSAVERAGGWDEYVRYHNEHSLFLRLHKRKRRGEYLVYDPDAKMQIRKDVPGGLNYRVDGEVRERVDTLAKYFLWVVGREHPLRIYGLLPLFVPTFAGFSAIAGYELSSGRPVNKWIELARGLAYAPRSLVKHARMRPPPRPRDWLASAPEETAR
jgi:glycosyltransferase involved in cell wall biosynthesis